MKRKIIVILLLLLGLATAVAAYISSRPEKLRSEVLSWLESQAELYGAPNIRDEKTGYVLEHFLSGYDMERVFVYISSAKSLRRVSSVPELEPPVVHFGERIVGSGGTLYYLRSDLKGAIEICLDENDGDWLELYSIDNGTTYSRIEKTFKEKMKQFVLENISFGDNDEYKVDHGVEIKTQDGLELLLRCIERCDYIYDLTGAVFDNIRGPMVLINGRSIGNYESCGYVEPITGRYAEFIFTDEDSEELRVYLEAVIAGNGSIQNE